MGKCEWAGKFNSGGGGGVSAGGGRARGYGCKELAGRVIEVGWRRPGVEDGGQLTEDYEFPLRGKGWPGAVVYAMIVTIMV